MAKKNVTNVEMLDYQRQILSLPPVFHLLFGAKFRQFFDDNNPRIESIQKKLKKVEEKYLEYDKEGKVVPREDNPKLAKLKEGMLEEDYHKEVNVIYDEITIVTY